MQSRNTSRRSNKTSRRLSVLRPHFSTQTVIGMILGVFIAYGGYFLLYASNTDRHPAAPGKRSDTSYRNQALPLSTLQEESTGSGKVQLAQAAPLNPQGVEAPAGEVNSPAEHRPVPPETGVTPAAPEAPAAPQQAAPAETVKKKKWTTRVKNIFTRKKDKTEATPQEAQETPAENPKGSAQGLGTSSENVDRTEQNLVRQVFGRDNEVPAAKQPEVVVPPVNAPAVPANARPAVLVQTMGTHPANSIIVTSGTSPRDATCRTLLFDASKSHDPDNDKLDYEWDFGDGTPSSDLVKTRHTFPQAGEYKITLKVTDNSTKECSTAITQKLVIVNTPPVAVGIFPKTLKTYQTGLFDARRSSDTPGDRLSYLWNFGDSTVAEGPVVTHQYNKAGEFPVILTVRDSSGSSCDTSTVTHAVKVEESPLEAPALALTTPEPIRPKVIAEPVPAVPVVHDTGAEMQGLLVQIRQHQGEVPREVVAKREPVPAPQPETRPAPYIPLQLASVQTPVPVRPVETRKEEKRYIPETHRYVLAWAGGYLVDCPTVQCGSETEVSFQNRLERRLNHLIQAVSSDRLKLDNLRDVSSEQKNQLAKHYDDLQALEGELVSFRNESTRYQKREFALAATRLDSLTRKVEETHESMLQAAAYTATNLQQIGEQLEAHEKDESRHKSAFETTQPYSQALQPRQEIVSRRLNAPPESE